MTLAPEVINLDLNNLLADTRATCDINSRVQDDSSPREKSVTLRYSLSAKHFSPRQILTTRSHTKLHSDILHLGLDPLQPSEDNLKKFYGIDVNRCTDVLTLQHLLAFGFRNFLYTMQWYESTLRERNKTFAHRLGGLKKKIRTLKHHEAPQMVVPATRRGRSRSMSTETTRLTANAHGSVKHRGGSAGGSDHLSLHTDRGMNLYTHSHAQHHHNRLNLESLESRRDVKPRRSLSRPVMLKKPHFSVLTFSQKRLGNRPGTPVPVSSAHKTPLWHLQHNRQLSRAPLSARSRPHAKHKDSGRNTNKIDDCTPVAHCRPCISSCKVSASMATKDKKAAGVVSATVTQYQLAGVHSPTEKTTHAPCPSVTSVGLRRAEVKRKLTS